MKKTLTANISGTVFHIEEDAFEKLHRYLDSIRLQFTGSGGSEEIMADIEARIAELFQERLAGGRQVVSITDVDHVISIMGQPEDYLDPADEPAANVPPGSGGPNWTLSQPRRKRLFRDMDDKWIGGVLGGVGAYFSIDPLVLRIIYIVLLFLGVGWLIYIILWIVVPPAVTAAEKLEMRGEPVNVENIKKVFDEGAERVRTGAEQMTKEAREMGQRYAPQARHGADEVMSFLGELFRIFFKVFAKVVGVVLLIGGALLAVMFMFLLLGQFAVFGLFEGSGGIANVNDLALLIFGERGWLDLTWIAITGFVLVPIIGLIHGGLSILFNISSPKWFGWVLTSVWIVSIVLLSVIGIRLAADLSHDEQVSSSLPLETPLNKVITITGAGAGWHLNDDDDDLDDIVRVENDSVELGWARLDVHQSKDSLYHLVIERNARGATDKMAANRATSIRTNWQQTDSILELDRWFSFDRGDLFRGQHVRYILEVPVGAAVHFDSSVGGMLDDVDNTGDTWDNDMIGYTWTMTQYGLANDEAPTRKERREHRRREYGKGSVKITIEEEPRKPVEEEKIAPAEEKNSAPTKEISTGTLAVPDLSGLFLRRIRSVTISVLQREGHFPSRCAANRSQLATLPYRTNSAPAEVKDVGSTHPGY